MRARTILLLAVGALAASLLYVPRLAWRAKQPRTLGLVIVDKSVPFRNYREHSGLTWIMRALKLTTPAGTFMEESKDYVGFDPGERKGETLTNAHVKDKDVMYIADTYGVYVGDYERPGDIAALERSPKIYGGVVQSEVDVIRNFSDSGGLVVGEFNSFASPTDEAICKQMEDFFGVRWTRWVGRFWDDLSDENEVPKWVGRLYERVYRKKFDLEGPAFVLVKEDRDIVILRPGEHLEPQALQIERTSERPDLFYGVPDRVPFAHWLDIVECTNCHVLFEYHFHTTQKGTWELRNHDLPKTFPAVVRRRGPEEVYYLAGDMVDNGVEKGDAEWGWIIPFRKSTAQWFTSTDDELFFFRFYAPMVTSLLERRVR